MWESGQEIPADCWWEWTVSDTTSQRQSNNWYHKPSTSPSLWPTKSIPDNTCRQTQWLISKDTFYITIYIRQKNIKCKCPRENMKKYLWYRKWRTQVTKWGQSYLKRTYTHHMYLCFYKLADKIQSKMLMDILIAETIDNFYFLLGIFYILQRTYFLQQERLFKNKRNKVINTYHTKTWKHLCIFIRSIFLYNELSVILLTV